MTKKFWKSALIRAVRTFCQSLVAFIGATSLISEIDWLSALSASALAGLLSILTSVGTGLPEAEESEQNG